MLCCMQHLVVATARRTKRTTYTQSQWPLLMMRGKMFRYTNVLYRYVSRQLLG
jgi:hypothetical protein